MRALISALAVAGLVAIALPSYAQNNDVKTNPKPLNAPGRAIDEGGAVKTDPKPLNSPGRAADDSKDVKTGKPAPYGRAADDTSTSKPATTSKSKKKKKSTQQPAPTN